MPPAEDVLGAKRNRLDSEGQVAQRSELTASQRSILRALGLPRFFDFTPATT